MNGSSQNYDGGHARLRPVRRALQPSAPVPPLTNPFRVRFTPPCVECFYPMLKGETACLRCGHERSA